MSIEIKKQGRIIIPIEQTDVICPVCGCEFSCTTSDFDHGNIKCPNPCCCEEIPFTESELYKQRETFQEKLARIKYKLREDILDNIDFQEIVKYRRNCPDINHYLTVEELQSKLIQIINQVIDEKKDIETLGFIVRYVENKECNEIGVDVCYSITNSSVYINTDTLELYSY